MKSLNEYLNENLTKVAKGTFKGFEQYKDKVLVSLEYKASDANLDNWGMPKHTVGFGFELNKTFKFPYDCFNLVITDGNVYMVLTQTGKRRLRVNTENGNYTMDDFLSKIKSIWKIYINRQK
jgi:hypothetical protein